MKVIERKISELKPYENNPRKNDEAVPLVANSIKEFGFRVPIIIDSDDVIVAGHTRLKAAISLGMSTVPCIVVDDLTQEQIKAFRLADNKVSEFAAWDSLKLPTELKDLQIDMEQFGFTSADMLEDAYNIVDDDTYSNSTSIPQYEITGECPPLQALVDEDKYQELVRKIRETKDIDEGVRQFLLKAATRHLAFNYKNIAEFYANASAEVQELMEDSALVIIDIEDAMRNGFVMLNGDIEALTVAKLNNEETLQ